MSLTFSGDERRFFLKNKFIEFEDLITPAELEKSDRLPKSRKLAEVAAELTDQKEIRFAFSRWINPSLKTADLKEMSSIQPVLIGLILHLGTRERPFDETDETFTPEPHKPRSGAYFLPDVNLNFHKMTGEPCLLIAYTSDAAVYKQNPKDPHTNDLRKLGYNFGDRLRNDHHPIIYRR